MSSENLLQKPDIKLSVKQTFGFDSDMKVGAFSKKNEFVPKIDTDYYQIDNDQQFILDFLKEEKVLLVQGSGFNWPKNDHFRVVFLASCEELASSLDKLAKYLKTRVKS